MRQSEYTIDGTLFTTLEEFYDHVGSVLIPGQSWGHNLDAFNDILSWPYFEDTGPYSLIWQNIDFSRDHLGYQETILWLEKWIKETHPSNIAHFVSRLDAAKRSEGQTLFDMLVEIIQSNHEYVRLILA